MPTTHKPDADTPTLGTWLLTFVVLAGLIFGPPVIAEAAVTALLSGN
ncbi:hypothetical protein [Microbacterium sp.]